MSQRIWVSGTDRPYLTPYEMSELLAFLYAPNASTPPGGAEGGRRIVGEPGDPQRGRQLVMDKECRACHSLSGTGGQSAGSLDQLKRSLDSPWIVIAAMWNHAFLMEVKTRSEGRAWPRLSSAEMADLVAFLQAGHPGR
jgi:mono/diheme cytochrome c family protein